MLRPLPKLWRKPWIAYKVWQVYRGLALKGALWPCTSWKVHCYFALKGAVWPCTERCTVALHWKEVLVYFIIEAIFLPYKRWNLFFTQLLATKRSNVPSAWGAVQMQLTLLACNQLYWFGEEWHATNSTGWEKRGMQWAFIYDPKKWLWWNWGFYIRKKPKQNSNLCFGLFKV